MTRAIGGLCSAIVAASIVSVAAGAQASGESADSAFVRAQRLVAAGHGDQGRAIVAQKLAAAPPGSARYAEALYWRAALAVTAAEAERDLRRVVVEFPLSSWTDDALMRLAQLELARGERTSALLHLERIALEHPASAAHARASYTAARLLLEMNELARGCGKLGDADARAGVGDAGLREQIAVLRKKCG
ncbi:MAG: hypothetical protein H7Z74_09785 [Anaerolineae bacterium]|nr:hypothetical protein [Gemmatimonadaceae bacterium]